MTRNIYRRVPALYRIFAVWRSSFAMKMKAQILVAAALLWASAVLAAPVSGAVATQVLSGHVPKAANAGDRDPFARLGFRLDCASREVEGGVAGGAGRAGFEALRAPLGAASERSPRPGRRGAAAASSRARSSSTWAAGRALQSPARPDREKASFFA